MRLVPILGDFGVLLVDIGRPWCFPMTLWWLQVVLEVIEEES